MENRFQYLFLVERAKTLLAPLALCTLPFNAQADTLKIDTEFFELGLAAGILNVKDFSSESTLGFNATFKATENFFLQSNFFKAKVSVSSLEEYSGIGQYTGDRNYKHFNLLLGYSVFQGEIFKGKTNAGLSSLYVTGGIGETKFLDESNFTYVLGAGYQMALSRRFTLNFNYNIYKYDSIVIDQEEYSVKNSHLSVGVNWLF